MASAGGRAGKVRAGGRAGKVRAGGRAGKVRAGGRAGKVRAGGRAGKVFSSGRLSLPVRPVTCKKRAPVRKSSVTSVDSGYSLCSTDSEDQVLDINRGLDRCAALLHDILQCDMTEKPLKPHKMPPTKGSIRSSTVKTKKTAVRKSAPHVYKEKGPLRRTLPPELCNPEVRRPCASSPPLILPSQNLDHVTTQMQHLHQVSSALASSAPSAPGPEASALYNCRLPTSTPTLSPQHPAKPQSSSNQDFHQTLPPGGVTHFPTSTPVLSSAFPMADNIQALVLPPSSVPAGYQATHQANILAQLDHYKSLIRDSDLLQCVANHLAQLQQSENASQNQAAAYSAESGPATESDETSGDEDDVVNALPVKDINCQTSFHKKKKSPEKTEKKIKTVKYLLGEIKTLLADQGDGAAMRLVTELEHSVSLLPMVVGSTNVHAEIALALQPLRSENAQLRRRLRILNQQLRERERSARTDEQNAEVTSLQFMNENLQHQLNESQKSLESLQSTAKMLEEESKKTAHVLEEKEQEIRHLKQQNEVMAASMKKEVEEAVGKMKSVQFKLEASEKENQILEITVRQNDAEITRLRELTRTLQASMAKLLCDLGKDAPNPKPDSALTQAALGSYDRQCPASTSIMNYLRRLETDQVFTGTDSIYSDNPLLPTCGQVSCSKSVNIDLKDDYRTSTAHDGPRNACPPVPPYSPHKPKPEIGSESCYLTSDEPRPDETLYLPLVSSPYKAKSDASLRRMCTPPETCSMDRDPDSSCPYYKNPGVHKDSQYASSSSDPTPKAHHEDFRLQVPPPRISGQPFPPPPALQRRTREDPTSDCSMFDGKPDWSICSFSTFTSHDEQEFRNGLAALDANIAKLQRTLQNGGTRK
ncbi:coiled-coil domain-containing protein 14 [Leptodactylus fuscus]|uniref:coiled-coil domain-containing protein 14 n=1 Tax=Leptodactylus fuscus TaxID=238119 RepID=UPI003F4ECAF6